MPIPKLIPALLITACACGGVNTQTSLRAPTHPQVGLVVMAHGGGADWNEEIKKTVAPLSSQIPNAVAFGMAEAGALEAALDSLTDLGVTHVALVRLFVSGESFLDRTAALLGLHAPGAVPAPDELHPAVTEWISRTASNIICGNRWSSALADCKTEYLVAEGSLQPPVEASRPAVRMVNAAT